VCQHVGPAANVIQSADGLLFVCANCGHENAVELTPAAPAAGSAADASTDTKPAPKPAKRPAWLDETRDRLIPEQGEGERCPKCLHLFDFGNSVCPRCGLDLDRAAQLPPGQAPWERPPPGLEEKWEQAQLLWSSAMEAPSDEKLDKFVAFVREEELTELGVRKLREYLVEHPDDDKAVAWLEEIAATFQARIMVARAQAEVSAEKFSESTEKFKRILLIVTAVYLTLLLAIALIYFLA
jgi:hypothetical protein